MIYPDSFTKYLYTFGKVFLIILFSGFTSRGFSQDTLYLDQAIDLALNNNYGIRIAKNNVQVQKNSATKGNAGLLPTLSASAGITYSNNNIKLIFAGENPPVSRNGASTWVTSASLNASYTIFDGLGSIRNYQNLVLRAEQGDIEARQIMENVILQVAGSYYTLAQLEESYQIALENLKISRERLERARSKNDFGVSNKLDVLNAEVDLNTDSISVLNAAVNKENTRRTLNQVIGRAIEQDFFVSKSVNYQQNLALEELLNDAYAKNVTLKSANYDKSIADLNLKIAESVQYPRLLATASYGYNRNKAEAGFILVNRNLGYTGGLNLSFDIYNGNQKKIQIQNAKINQASIEENYQNLKQQVELNIRNAFAQYKNDLFVLEVEKKNVTTAELNFERTRDQYNFGQLTSTQFREAQVNLLLARTSLNAARYTAKLSEINLLQLSGKILEKTE